MTISYPRSFPAGAGFITVDFKLGDLSVQNTLENGAIQVMEMGEALWSATFTTFEMTMADRQRWQAWALTLRLGKPFYAYDPEKVYPTAYGASVLNLTRAGGGAYDGTATLAAVTAKTVQLTGLPNGYKASAGDMLSFPWNGGTALHMVVEDATASGSGGVTLTVAPPVRLSPLPSISSTVQLVQPVCVMKLKPGTFSAPAGFQPQSVTFEAVQDITGASTADYV
ncbi:hypothetical protein [Xanthobacter aminoxidans]|uniref:Uncharacterized protein n=1 Tax=Xanthobacter aminoxidans TaxID=186280 RepID=A0ABW6ZA10_9HYPH